MLLITSRYRWFSIFDPDLCGRVVNKIASQVRFEGDISFVARWDV
jgi:hypothetical protein